MLTSHLCTQADMNRPDFQEWGTRMKLGWYYHRKLWEWAYIAQALHERAMLCPGVRGLGFAVGQEPLTALFASMGSEVTASDLHPEAEEAAGWAKASAHASNLEAIDLRGICPADELARRVTFRGVDMNRIPPDLRDYDFVWSSCAFEHLGSLEAGVRFLVSALDCLRPGGVAVHTTELNLSSDRRTIEDGPTVLYRERDLREVAAVFKALGHAIELDFGRGHGPADRYVDEPPYYQVQPAREPSMAHLKLRYGSFVITSFGLIVQKSLDTQAPDAAEARRRLLCILRRRERIRAALGTLHRLWSAVRRRGQNILGGAGVY